MKKILFPLLICTFFLTFSPTMVFANTDPVTTELKDGKEENDAKALLLNNRLEEINGIDMSDLDRSEKKALKKEVKEIKKELKAIGNGVYISTGAIIIIILLILLL